MKKESLSVITVKTLLAVLLFAGMGTIIIGGGYIIWEYSKNIVENKIVKPVDQETENYYNLLEKKCNGDNCCLSSFKTMRDNNYKEADKNGKCPEGFFMNMMKCITSYQWCEPIKKTESEITDFKVESHQTFSYDGASMAMDCKFLYGEVRSGKFESKKLLVYFPNYTTYPNYLKLAEYIEKDATIKIFLTNDKSILRNKFNEIYGKNYERGFPYYCLKDEDMDNSKKNDYASQEIFALKMPDEEDQFDTSDWQTYRNEEFGFEVKYPEEWKENKTRFDDLAIFESPERQKTSPAFPQDNQAIMSVQVYSDKNMQEEIDIEKLGARIIDKNASIIESEIFIDDIIAKQTELLYQRSEDNKYLEISTYLNYKNNLYIIHLLLTSITDQNIEEETINIYNSFLSSFKFIEN